MGKGDIARYSLDELKARRREGAGQSRTDAPERDVDPAFWETAELVMPVRKASVHLRLDADVLDWFRGQGRGHLTRMNAVLRSYMEAQIRKGS